MASPREHIQAAYDNWNTQPRGVDPEVLQDIGYATPETLPDVLQSVLARQAIEHAANPREVPISHDVTPGTQAAEVAQGPKPTSGKQRQSGKPMSAKEKMQKDVGSARAVHRPEKRWNYTKQQWV